MNNSTNSRIAAETSVHELALVFLRHFESRSGLRCRETVVQALKLWSKKMNDTISPYTFPPLTADILQLNIAFL